jgi:hypothetical protein
MAQSFYLREQAAVSPDSIDPDLRDSLLRLAGEYAAQASAGQRGDTAVWQAGGSEDDQRAA